MKKKEREASLKAMHNPDAYHAIIVEASAISLFHLHFLTTQKGIRLRSPNRIASLSKCVLIL